MASKAKNVVAGGPAASLREGWSVVRFDEMAQLVNDRVDDPSKAGVERYVGLEHLDPESLKIRRWGVPTDVEAQKLRFQPGDIIFGKRRAYQRKLAVADFEGICSAHAMVLRAREEMVIKEFLPFFMQSDIFFDRALSISVGSLSPTINWKTLASQTFTIPPKDEQRRIADILWAADDAIQRFGAAVEDQKKLKSAMACDSFTVDEQIPTMPLGQVGTWMSGGTPSRARNEFWNGNISWASPKDMKVDVLNETIETISEEGAKNGTRLVSKDSIFIVIRGMILAHTFPVAIAGKRMAFNQDMKALVVSQDFDAKFIFHWLLHKANDLLGMASESSHGTKRLPTEILFQVPVPHLTLDKQTEVAELLQSSDDVRKQLERHKRNLETLKAKLLYNLLTQ